ncbi:ribonuclease H family protein [Priestia filamentosa]|uniref:ribonuclease H1 domain-containing protein n=1 Tax=Priestia filamentosa TaxID=1402861 RepID=UPI00397C07F6
MARNKVYVVRKGRKTGVFTEWSECQEQISGYPSAEYRSFSPYNQKEINKYLNGKPVLGDKFYAVKRGRRVGVYQSWEECKQQIDGLENAVYKSFPTNTQAYEYLGVRDKRELLQLEIEQTNFYDENSGFINVYVDGSYNQDFKVYSTAFVVIENGVVIHKKSDLMINKEVARTMGSMSGELAAAMRAINAVAKAGYKKVMIHHDNLSIRNLIEGTDEPRNEFHHQYITYVDNLKRKYGIKIEFMKVKAHNGNKWNELVDTMAKEEIAKYISTLNREN